MDGSADTQQLQPQKLDHNGRKIIRMVVLFFTLNLAVLLLSAGTWNYPRAYFLCGFTIFCQCIMIATLMRKNPELLNERAKMVKSDTKGFDRWFFRLYFPLVYISLTTAALDSTRFGWSDVPLTITAAAYVVLFCGYLFAFWAMLTNTHFESTVRIQNDRNHKVIESGPYAYVRHPGYVGGIIAVGALPLLLGSLYAYIPVACALVVFLTRTMLEDKTLRAELDGYQDYAQRVRYRLVPGIW